MSAADRVSEFLNYLQLKNEYGQTIYGHLAQIVAKLLDDHPADAVAAISVISREIKASVGALDRSDASTAYQPLLSPEDFAKIEEILSLYGRRNPSVASGEARPPALQTKTVISDVVLLNEQLKLLGYGLEDSTAALIQKRMDRFVEDRPGYFASVHFFGRIQTAAGYYYVLECLPSKPRRRMYRFDGEDVRSVNSDIQLLRAAAEGVAGAAGADSTDGATTTAGAGAGAAADGRAHTFMTARKIKALSDEARAALDPDGLGFDLATIPPPPRELNALPAPTGDNVHPEGVNRYLYFVASDIVAGSPEGAVGWTRLPDVEARQLQLSRFVHTSLSGVLTARVYDRLPPFPGVEAHYLRCLVARIKHGSELAPAACLAAGEEPDEVDLTEDEAAREQRESLLSVARTRNIVSDTIEDDEPSKALVARRIQPWPVRNREIESVEYADLLEPANWAHTCPVLSHRGKVLPWTAPEEPDPDAASEEPEEEPEKEPEEPDGAEEDGAEGGEREPPRPTLRQRLDALYRESDQHRILAENADALRQVARAKARYTVPTASWQTVRDPWDPAVRENRGIYIPSRYFATEMAPVDINCQEQELDEKEQAYWDAEQEAEDRQREADEALEEGDAYDDEREVATAERPEVLATADTDAALIVHTGGRADVNVNFAEDADGVQAVPAYTVVVNRTLNRHSPVLVRSNRWRGMLNVVFNYSSGDPLTYTSVYLGDGTATPRQNSLEAFRACLPPAMCLPPADLLEEPDPCLEVENETKERLFDAERREKDKLDREERERQEAEEAAERERQEAAAAAAAEAAEEGAEGEDEGEAEGADNNGGDDEA